MHKKKKWKKLKISSMTAGLLLIFFTHMAGISLYLYDSRPRGEKQGICISRPESGEGDQEKTLTAKVGGEEKKITIQVKEKVYSEKEAKEIFQKIEDSLENKIKGKNKSLKKVEYPLALPEEAEGYPVSFLWNSSRTDILDQEGKIGENPGKEGSKVNLICTLELGEYFDIWEKEICVFPEKLSPEKKLQKEIQKAIDRDNPARSEKIRLPATVLGETIEYKEETDQRGLTLALLGTIVGCSIPLLEKEKQKQEKKSREEKLREDYPELINRILLLLQAGMTVRGAFEKIADAYRKETAETKKAERPAYEEVLLTYREMEGGISESRAYERFGSRCGISEYKVLSVLLVQNLKKGNPEVLDLLEREACGAREERKRKIKIGGEEADTKLLGPMLIQLCIVAAVIIIPVFLGFCR